MKFSAPYNNHRNTKYYDAKSLKDGTFQNILYIVQI